MTPNKDKLISLSKDAIEHKKIVLDCSQMLFEYLVKNDKHELGIALLKRAAEHDNSKFESDEFELLANILTDDKGFTDANYSLSDEETKAINIHWHKNRHHPEYFSDASNMSELDMIEMVCDWFARSLQYKTDFLPFVLERQKTRFHFEKEQFNFIYSYCELIEKLYKEKL